MITRKRNKKELEGCSFLLVCLFQDFLMAAVCTLGLTLMQLSVLMFECDHLVRVSGNSNHGPNCGAASVCPLVC